MADYIPFVNTVRDCEVLNRYYSDAEVIRLSPETATQIIPKLRVRGTRWVDACIDGLHKWPPSSETYKAYIAQFPGYDQITDPSFQKAPDKILVKQFTDAVLASCLSLRPDWISVPQLPQVGNSSRNKVNRLLALSAKNWKLEKNYAGKFVLPVIVTHQSQLNSKTSRNPKVALVKQCAIESGADLTWVVDSTLYDQEGSGTFDTLRFPGLVQFHQELNDALPNGTASIGGPYWGMNLVLWARGLVKYAAIGLGNSYQYRISGGKLQPSKVHVALTPLRRWATATPQLKGWLVACLDTIPREDKAHAHFTVLLRDFGKLNRDTSRIQVARFYKKWFDHIAAHPEAGRALALYQDLSSAYVLGTGLPELPSTEGPGRRPEKVPKQFMLSCLLR